MHLLQINYFGPREEFTLEFVEPDTFLKSVSQVPTRKPRFSLLAKKGEERKECERTFLSREAKTHSTYFRGNHNVHNSCTGPSCFTFPFHALMRPHRTFLSNEIFREMLTTTSTHKRPQMSPVSLLREYNTLRIIRINRRCSKLVSHEILKSEFKVRFEFLTSII